MANERKSRCGSARFVLLVLLGLPFHRAGGPIGLGGLARLLLDAQLLGLLAIDFKDGPTAPFGIEHLQRAAAGIDFVVMGEIGEAFEDAEQLLVPGPSPDLHIAGPALRTERPKPRQLVATLRSRRQGEAAERAHRWSAWLLPA